MKARWILCVLLLCFIHPRVFAQLELPKLISDGMVLQRDQPITIWGWAKNASMVRVNFMNASFDAEVNTEGKWKVEWPATPAGGPYDMEIIALATEEVETIIQKDENDSSWSESTTIIALNPIDTIQIHDILLGDVWLCSGQSNMEMPMRRVEKLYAEWMKNAHYGNIRYFDVPIEYNFLEKKKKLNDGQWLPVTPENISSFSAVAYFFALHLHEKLSIPIGIIESSLGGSPAEAWISEEYLQSFPYHISELNRVKKKDFVEGVEMNDRYRTNNWYGLARKNDTGYSVKNAPWYLPSTEIDQWKNFDMPRFWNESSIGEINGIVWFAKDVQLNNIEASSDAVIELGAIVDADSVWINGSFIGTTSYKYPPRIYKIPAGVLKEGNNRIVVRVISNIESAGFIKDKPYELRVKDQTYSLMGEWKYRVGTVISPLKPQTFFRNKPTGLYNNMIYPLIEYPIKGVVWYQGESNTARPMEYEQLMIKLIENWREDWKQPELPFLIVQLANFMEEKQEPSESHWAHTRQSQYNLSTINNVFVAPAIDLGEWNDIHPLNKKDLSDRLASIARRKLYGDNQVYASGPIYSKYEIVGDTVVIHFKNIGSGLVANDGKELKHFAIAGWDQKFVWGKAWIEDNVVKVYSPQIKRPVAVRYAWADNPASANLYNGEGWPCFPFRTDDWAFIP